MSDDIDTRDAADDAGPLTEVYRTVTPGYTSHSDDEMNVVGWAVFLGLLLILFPLLPFVAVIWGVSKVIETVTGEAEPEE